MLISLLAVIIFGLCGKRLFEHIKLPGLVGLVFVGVLAGPSLLNVLEPGFLAFSGDIRMLALIIILLRAGLGLDMQVLKRIGKPALKLSMLPALFEGLAVMMVFRLFFGFSWAEGGVMGFILAAVSPAVIVPSMLELRERGLGRDKSVPEMVLASASADDVFAITVFSIFLGVATGTGRIKWFLTLARIPYEIIAGIFLGLAAGCLLVFLFARIRTGKVETVLIATSAAVLVVLAGEAVHAAGLIGVISMGFIVLEKRKSLAFGLEESLKALWLVAQLFLFVLIGAAVNISVAWRAGLPGLAVILTGLLFRFAGVLISTRRSGLNIREQLFCCVANIPKATVQAAIGGLPLALGLPAGEIILAVSVLSIIITAPIGAVTIKWLAPFLLTAGGKQESDTENDEQYTAADSYCPAR